MSHHALRLGFIGLNSAKREDASRYYKNIVGLPIVGESEHETRFACGFGSHAVSLHDATQPGFRHLGLQIAGSGPLDDALAALREAGVDARLTPNPVHGVASAIEMSDPDGHIIYLYRDETVAGAHYPASGIAPLKLGHVALFVKDAERSERFYIDNLGFRVSDWIEKVFVFLRCGTDHHSLNFLSAAHPGMFHFAFELRDANHLMRSCDELGKAGVKIDWGPGRHGPGHNLYTYHRDPDGNIVELYAELDTMSSEALGYFDPRPHHRDVPQRPKSWSFSPDIDIWGAPPPPEFVPGGV